MNTGSTLITGSSGALGELVYCELIAMDCPNLIVASRTPGNIPSLRTGVRRRRIDFDLPATLDAAFSGVRRALIVSTDALAIPGVRQRQQDAALQAARRSGVRHVAYTSMPNPHKSGVIPFAADHVSMEDAMTASGLEISILRNSWYQENLLAYLPEIVNDGTWFTSAEEGRIAYVARADAAAVAAKAIVSDSGHGIVDIAGPEALTVSEIAQILSDELGKSIRVEHVSQDELKRQLIRQGVAPRMASMVALTELNQVVGNFAIEADTTVAFLGRPPKPLSLFIREHASMLLPVSSR